MKFTKIKNKKLEVFRVFPEYQKVSKTRKKNVLLTLKKWVEDELNKLKLV